MVRPSAQPILPAIPCASCIGCGSQVVTGCSTRQVPGTRISWSIYRRFPLPDGASRHSTRHLIEMAIERVEGFLARSTAYSSRVPIPLSCPTWAVAAATRRRPRVLGRSSTLEKRQRIRVRSTGCCAHGNAFCRAPVFKPRWMYTTSTRAQLSGEVGFASVTQQHYGGPGGRSRRHGRPRARGESSRRCGEGAATA